MKYIANPVEVEAFKIVQRFGDRDEHITQLELENGEIVDVTDAMQSRYVPQAGDYWVIQSDGYIYLNPKDVFERKYRPTEAAGLPMVDHKATERPHLPSAQAEKEKP